MHRYRQACECLLIAMSLPPGWSEYKTDDGQVCSFLYLLIVILYCFTHDLLLQSYYYNENTQETTWDRPAPPRAAPMPAVAPAGGGRPANPFAGGLLGEIQVQSNTDDIAKGSIICFNCFYRAEQN